MPFTIIRQDITQMKVDAIVNAANTELLMGGGVCGAIFKAAGVTALTSACAKLAPIHTGDAVITSGFGLPSKYVIHTAGPVYQNGHRGEAEKLKLCYINSLKRAIENACESIAFPLISSGIYGYPKAEALSIAIGAIQEFLERHELEVYLVVFDNAAFEVSEKLLGDIESYMDAHYVNVNQRARRDLLDVEIEAMDVIESLQLSELEEPCDAILQRASDGLDDSLEDYLEQLDEPFTSTLLRLIDIKGKSDVEVYKRANIDRKLFSKIRTGKGYMPSKRTIIALAIALELSLEETDKLLARAGYTLSHSQKFDVIVEYFILNEKYDIYEINTVLFKYDQPLLGA